MQFIFADNPKVKNQLELEESENSLVLINVDSIQVIDINKKDSTCWIILKNGSCFQLSKKDTIALIDNFATSGIASRVDLSKIRRNMDE